MVMTREEDIRERVDTCGAYYTYDGRKIATIEAEADLRYLLARNEELQRRVERLENGIQSALEYWNRSETDGAMVDALFTIEERLEKAIDAVDAEEK